MALVPAKCTQCGANITVDETKEAGICASCGTPFITEKAINKYNITNSYNAEVINVYNTQESSLTPLIKRVFLLLEDGEFDKAKEFCETALNQSPENAEVYLAALMAEVRIGRKEDLMQCKHSFENNNNYQKILRFGDPSLIDELKGYIEVIKKRNEEEQRFALYCKGLEEYKSSDEARLQNAMKIFSSLSGYKESDKYIELCQYALEKIQLIEIQEKNDKKKALILGIAAVVIIAVAAIIIAVLQ